MKKRQAIIWPDPLVAKTINQLLGEFMRGELDYLIVDLPPGTGNPSITIAHALPKVRVLMVTTPKEVALVDVRRSIELFERHKGEVFGLIKNMSYFHFPRSEKSNFYKSGGK